LKRFEILLQEKEEYESDC